MSKKPVYVMGIDPSSTCCGVTVLKDGKPLIITHHKSNKKLDLGRRIFEFGEFLQQVKKKTGTPSLLAVEELAYFRNANTVRKICYFEGKALDKAGQWRSPTLLIKVNDARRKVLGAAPEKEKVYGMMLKKGYKFTPLVGKKNEEAYDESDSLIVALAGYKKLQYG